MNSYVAVDLETTGLATKTDKIMEIGMIKVVEGKPAETFHTMVNPGRELTEQIVSLTGITKDMLADAPAVGEVIGPALSFIGELPLLGHKIIFDYAFLKQAAVNKKMEFEAFGIDTLKLCRKFMPPEEKKNLGAACAYFGIRLEGAHRAAADAEAAHLLYQELKKRFLRGSEADFVEKQLKYQAKKEKNATKRQKEHLQDLIKYHKINVSAQIESLSGNEISRFIDKIILQYGRIPERGRERINLGNTDKMKI